MPQKIPETLKKRGYNSTNFKVLKVFFLTETPQNFRKPVLKKEETPQLNEVLKNMETPQKKEELHLNCF